MIQMFFIHLVFTFHNSDYLNVPIEHLKHSVIKGLNFLFLFNFS